MAPARAGACGDWLASCFPPRPDTRRHDEAEPAKPTWLSKYRRLRVRASGEEMYECDDGPARARAVTVTPTPTFFRPAASAIGELWPVVLDLLVRAGPSSVTRVVAGCYATWAVS